MVEHGAFLVPTLTAPFAVIEAGDAGVGVDAELVERAREVVEQHRESFARAVDAGVRIAMGSDSGITPQGRNLRELELMTAYGMSPAQSLRAATASGAELLGMGAELGTIAVGKRADLVLVEGDALDVATLRSRVRQVVRDGVIVVGAPGC